jgi:hypothetical protein
MQTHFVEPPTSLAKKSRALWNPKRRRPARRPDEAARLGDGRKGRFRRESPVSLLEIKSRVVEPSHAFGGVTNAGASSRNT